MLNRLKQPRLSSGTKRDVRILNQADGRLSNEGVKLTGAVRAGYVDIINRLMAGDPLPEHCYRRSDGRTDSLLQATGILHLHLTPGSNELLFLIEYEDTVLFIQLNTHTPYDYDPNIIAYFQHEYMTQIADWEYQEQRRRTALAKNLKSGFEKLKASIKKPPAKDEQGS